MKKLISIFLLVAILLLSAVSCVPGFDTGSQEQGNGDKPSDVIGDIIGDILGDSDGDSDDDKTDDDKTDDDKTDDDKTDDSGDGPVVEEELPSSAYPGDDMALF